jgi:hypothetical protein
MSYADKSAEKWFEGEKALLHIVGARLTSVQFVLNYLILGFDEKGALTTLVWPEVVKGTSISRIGSLEYRNDLCALIERFVDTATIQQDETINILFDNGIELLIRLRSYTGMGERMILNVPKGSFRVF